jgi:threonine dehydrogenase-like Zn-dependent dehydrogenase
MKVPFVHGPGDLRLLDVPAPQAGPRDVVLKIRTVGICGSDLNYIAMGGIAGPTRNPVPLGHELSGIVAAIGGEVTSVAVGDRVVINPLVNLVGNGGPEGGFAEELLIRDVVGRPQSLLPLPAGISMDVGALVEPLAVATHAINRLGARPGDKVAVFGAGPIGLAAVAMLRQRGIDDVVAFDLSDFRRDRAKKLGARDAFDPRYVEAREALMAAHGSVPLFRAEAPATTHFLEASGAAIVPDIVGIARPGASICIVSLQKKPAAIDLVQVMSKELTLSGALGYPHEFDEVLGILRDGDIALDAMISHRFDGSDVMKAFEMAARPDKAAKVLVRYSEQ